MGADGWKVQILHGGRDVGWSDRALSRLAGRKGFRREADLQPWSHDSEALAFLAWDKDQVHIYDVATKALRHVPCGPDLVYSVQWSPGVDRLLVTSPAGGVLTNQGGVWRAPVTWTIAPHERPDTQWTSDGHWFFVLGRESVTARTMLTFYAAEDGRAGDAVPLDPIDLVPYDADPFVEVRRDRFSLVVSPSGGAVGHLLDVWHSVEFDQPSSTLYLAVYRPVSAPHQAGGEWFCDVEERWVAVEIGN